MSDTLEVKKENVQKAAETCGTAKEVLEELFPEAFEDTMSITPFRVEDNRTKPIFIGHNSAPSGLEQKCLVLNDDYEWEFTKNKFGDHILIPRKK